MMKSHLLAAGLLASATLPAQPQVATTDERETAEKSAPYATKAEQYTAAQKRLGVLKLGHGETHPLVVQQQALVATLQLAARAENEKKAKQTKSGDDKAMRLAKAKNDLTKLLEDYTEAHPQVVAQRRLIAELEAQR